MTDVLGKKSSEYYSKTISDKYEHSGAFQKIQSGMTKDALSIINFKKGLILDLGCGTGHSTIIVKNTGHKVVGLDNNPNMIQHAANKGLNKLVIADFTHLPFKNKSFTGIISISSIQWIQPTKYSKLIKEIKRILIPAGKIIIQHYPQNKQDNILLMKEARKQGFKTIKQTIGTGRKTKEYILLF